MKKNRNIEELPEKLPNVPQPASFKFKVYSEYEKIGEYLKHPAFEMTNEKENADIWWLYLHFNDFK